MNIMLRYTHHDIELYNNIYAEREEEIRHINREMRDVNDMMNMIGSQVSSQSDSIDNIVSNISDSKDNCKYANDEVKKAQEYQDKENDLYWILGAGIGVPTVIGFVIASVIML